MEKNMEKPIPCLYMVIPCYNEQTALSISLMVLEKKMTDLEKEGKIRQDSRCLLVDDGSKDGTWKMIQQAHQNNPLFTGIRFAHNRGQQYALLAGLMEAKDRCDCAISMDVDLQDDINAIDMMLADYRQGCDVVYGVRNNRESDTAFKRMTAEKYYKLLSKMGAEVIYNHSEFRLMSKKTLEALADYGEENVYLRGLIPMIGYPSSQVSYERRSRVAGESKYPLRKLIDTAAQGITSLTTRPLRWITEGGMLVSLIALIVLIVSIVKHARGTAPLGWPSLIASLWILGGLILSAIGIVGEYVGKAYVESKRRPRWLIDENLLEEEENEEKIAPAEKELTTSADKKSTPSADEEPAASAEKGHPEP